MTPLEYFTGPMLSLDGWCPTDKALKIYTTIKSLSAPLAGVEIGVFGGRSLIPAAMGARDGPGGHILGVDPYSAAAAQEFSNAQAETEWWGALDYDAHFQRCDAEIARLELRNFCGIARSTSQAVSHLFADLNYAHIDGNHNEAAVRRDLVHWLPKILVGGILVLDDTNDVEIRAAMTIMNSTWVKIWGTPTWEIWTRIKERT